MTSLKLINVSNYLGGKKVLKKINLNIEKNNIVCLLGPSGSGKTSLLRVIAGLQTPEEGQIILDGQDISKIPTHKRNFGMMFQDLALFPHKNVFENIAFGLQIKKKSKQEAKEITNKMLELVELEDYAHRTIDTLSGGQCQRVALARSLAPTPKLLMLDEPLGSLDVTLRERLAPELRSILKQVEMTSIFVTHDHKEAFTIADQIAIIINGQIKQIDTPVKIHQNPTSAVVARFLGFKNILEGEINNKQEMQTPIGLLKTNDNINQKHKTAVLLRPNSASIAKEEQNENIVRGVVVSFVFQGSYYKLNVKCNEKHLSFEMPINTIKLSPGQNIKLFIDPSYVKIL